MLLKRKSSPEVKEWLRLCAQEAALEQAAARAASPRWKEMLEQKVPDKAVAGLQASFCKGFALVFAHGTKLLEKTYDPDALRRKHAYHDDGVMHSGKRREFRKLRTNDKTTQLGNLAVTTAEGVVLGALGIGMPDIVIFLGMLLRGIYETALNYGFAYDTPREQLLILKMMETSLRRGPDWQRCNAEVERLMASEEIPDGEQLQKQIQKTAEAFAMDMLILKFVQGLPVVGMLGGAANPVYYRKVMRYVQLKYQKRYLRSVAQRKGIPLE